MVYREAYIPRVVPTGMYRGGIYTPVLASQGGYNGIYTLF